MRNRKYLLNENILSAFFKCTMKHPGILKSHIVSLKGLPCSLKTEHLPGDVFRLHSKNRVTGSSEARKISAFSARWFSHCSWTPLFKTVFSSFSKNLFIMLKEHYSFFPPSIAATDRLNPAKHNYPEKWLTNHRPFSRSVTWDRSVWATEQQHWAIRAPNEMIQDLSRANACSSAKSELQHLFELGISH